MMVPFYGKLPKTIAMIIVQGDSSPGSLCGVELVRRPVLPSAVKRLDPLEDEHSLHMLYDYTTVHAW